MREGKRHIYRDVKQQELFQTWGNHQKPKRHSLEGVTQKQRNTIKRYSHFVSILEFYSENWKLCTEPCIRVWLPTFNRVKLICNVPVKTMTSLLMD